MGAHVTEQSGIFQGSRVMDKKTGRAEEGLVPGASDLCAMWSASLLSTARPLSL